MLCVIYILIFVICFLKATICSTYSLYVACLTERARIEAQIKTAEAAARTRAEEESRQRREKEREAARVAIEKVLFIIYNWLQVKSSLIV